MTRKEPLVGKYTVIEAHIDLASDIRKQLPRSTSFDRRDNAHFSGGRAFGHSPVELSSVGKKKNYFEILGVNHDCTGGLGQSQKDKVVLKDDYTGESQLSYCFLEMKKGLGDTVYEKFTTFLGRQRTEKGLQIPCGKTSPR